MFDVGPPLLERQAEIGVLGSMLAQIGSGRGAAVLVAGDPGIGKSALLGAVTESARQQGLQMISATGVQSEAELPFAALQQLLRPLDDYIAILRPAQAAALSTAIGRADGPAGDVFTVAMAVLDLLAEAAAAQALLISIDDVQWVDTATDRVLSFVARRLGNDPMMMVAAIRDGYSSVLSEVGLPILHLQPLSDDDADRLLRDRHPDLGVEERRAARRIAGGNPLALVELPRSVARITRSDDLAATADSAQPLTTRLQRSFAARLAEFDATTRWVVLVAATDDAAELDELVAASRRARPGAMVSAEAFYPAVDAGLLQISDHRVRFLHPLVRSAIHQSASASERHDAHAALAAVLENHPERRAWHLAAAGSGPDESVAVQLEQAGRSAEHRGARAVGASAWERAAVFSADDTRRGARLLRAAELRLDVGELDAAGSLLMRADPLLDSLVDRARAALVRDGVGAVPPPGDSDRLRSLWDLAVLVAEESGDADGIDLAARLLLLAAQRVWATDPGPGARATVVAAAGRLPIPPDDPRRLSIVGYADPRGYESALSDRVSRMTADDVHGPGAELVLSVYLIGDSRLAALQRSAVDGVRSRGLLVELPRMLTLQSWTAIAMADWQVALPGLSEAIQLAEETRQPLWQAAAMTGLAMVDVLRGELDAAHRLITGVEAMMLPRRTNPVLCGVQLVRGISAIAGGRFDTAYTQLLRLFDAGDPAYHPVQSLWALGDFVEAAAHSGNLEAARQVVERVRPPDGEAVSPWTRAALLYAHPFLAEPDSVEQEYRSVLSSELARWPSYHARLTLQYGQWLRHQRRVNESRAPLRAAREAADAFGLSRWAERARQELRATGEASVATTPAVWASLSPQELQIARLAAEGMSNREIGQRLYLSHRTVGSHLYRLFPKLGVTTRAQLRAALETDRDPLH